jgi:hypothetical protein
MIRRQFADDSQTIRKRFANDSPTIRQRFKSFCNRCATSFSSFFSFLCLLLSSSYFTPTHRASASLLPPPSTLSQTSVATPPGSCQASHPSPPPCLPPRPSDPSDARCSRAISWGLGSTRHSSPAWWRHPRWTSCWARAGSTGDAFALPFLASLFFFLLTGVMCDTTGKSGQFQMACPVGFFRFL